MPNICTVRRVLDAPSSYVLIHVDTDGSQSAVDTATCRGWIESEDAAVVAAFVGNGRRMDVAEAIPAIFNVEWKNSRRFTDSSFGMSSREFALKMDSGRWNLESDDDEGNRANA